MQSNADGAMDRLVRLAESVAEILISRKETIAVGESSTGGLISAALLSVPGASAYFYGGAVVYTRRARRALLQIPNEAVTEMRSASEPYAALCCPHGARPAPYDLGTGRNGRDRSQRQSLRRRRRPLLYRAFWSGRENAHHRDRQSRPSRQHVRLREKALGELCAALQAAPR